MLTRIGGALALLLLVVIALGLRLAAAPTAGAVRIAIAPAPGASVYVAAHDGLRVVDVTGRQQRRGVLPGGQVLALAADGDTLLLGAGDGLFASFDGGRSWGRQPLPPGRYAALAVSGGRQAAAAWGDALWLRDGGAWYRATLPAGDTEVGSIALGPEDLVATLLGVDGSADHRAFSREPGLPGRMTAVQSGPGRLLAAAWGGEVFESGGAGWTRTATYGAGIWAIDGDTTGVTAATTTGLRTPSGPALAGREVIALARSGDTRYAALAGREVVAGPVWHRVLQD